MPPNLENSTVVTGLEKVSFSFQSQKKAMSKNAQTTSQLYSSHTLAKHSSKFSKLGFTVNRELPEVQAGFRKSRGTRNQIANIFWIIKKAREYKKNLLLLYSAYKLNKQGGYTQPWCTPFPIWNQSVVLCSLLTVASWPAYRFLRRQVR